MIQVSYCLNISLEGEEMASTLNSEQLFFLSILRDFIHGNKSNCANDYDQNQICQYAKMHGIQAIVYYQTKYPALQRAYAFQLYRDMKIKNEISLILSNFDKEGIPIIVVKGNMLSDYYPIKNLRSAGDVDFVVDINQKKNANELFNHMGYQNIGEKGNRAWHYKKNGIEVELHHALMYDTDLVNNQKDFCNKYQKYIVENHGLEKNFHFLFVLMHLEKHLVGEGIGLKQFLDIAVLTKNADLNWEWIKKTAIELKIYPFLKKVLCFVKRWFEIDTPFEDENVDESFFVQATCKILSDGAFGFEDIDNKQNSTIKQIKIYGKAKMMGRFIKRVFPSYSTLCATKEYSFIKKFPVLLPAAWGHRLFLKWNRRKQVVGKYFVDGKKIDKRTDFLKKWGISEL